MFKEQEHKKKINDIIDIKSNMNDKITYFTWNHLQKFYNLYD
jgi:hypothetical protein